MGEECTWSQIVCRGNCSPCLALGGSRGRGCRGTPAPALHPGSYIFKGKDARWRRASAHVTSSFFPSPPPTWLFSPTSRPARGGLGGVLKIHLQPQNVQQQPSTPLDSGGLSWGTRGHRALRGRLVPVRCQGPGRLVIRNNSYDGGSWGMGGEAFLPRSRSFSLVSLKVGC